MKSIDAIEPAIEATKNLLFPIKIKKWFKLAFVSFFAGKPTQGNIQLPINQLNNQNIQFTEISFFLAQHGIIIGLFVFFLMLIGLVFSYINSFFSFVFVEDLIEKKSSITGNLSKNSKKAFSYFLFNIFLAFITIFSLLLFLSPALFLILTGNQSGTGIVLGIILFFVWLISAGLIISIISSFTWEFVLPLMHLKQKGVIVSWNELKKIILKEKKEFLVYIIVSIILNFIGIIASAVLLIPLFIIIILFSILFLLIILIFDSLNLLTLPVLALFALILIPAIFLFFCLAIVSILPVNVFFRYYPMIFLGKVDKETKKLLKI